MVSITTAPFSYRTEIAASNEGGAVDAQKQVVEPQFQGLHGHVRHNAVGGAQAVMDVLVCARQDHIRDPDWHWVVAAGGGETVAEGRILQEESSAPG
jgi:hypothetical protein